MNIFKGYFDTNKDTSLSSHGILWLMLSLFDLKTYIETTYVSWTIMQEKMRERKKRKQI